MPDIPYGIHKVPRDLGAGVVVFLIAMPFCVGVAFTQGAPLISGVLAGIVGGIVVGLLSRSNTSVSGPSPALIAIVVVQLAALGSFQAFQLALALGGLIQIAFGVARAGFLSAFIPSSVIKGLLAAVGVLLILKQIPLVLGHDTNLAGAMVYRLPDQDISFSSILQALFDLHPGAALVGIVSVALLILWEYSPRLKQSQVPGPLVVVVFGILTSLLCDGLNLARLPLATLPEATIGELIRMPDFAQWGNPTIYTSAVIIALVASLETLLNLTAVDKIDPRQRQSPADRELIVQGFGNFLLGLVGGIPMTPTLVGSSVNIHAGSQSKLSTIVHGVLLALCVFLLPVLHHIPLACLGAILIVTGAKLATPAVFKRMWQEGRSQFIPYLATMLAIVCTDMLIGILIGFAVSIRFILSNNLRKPVRRVVEKHLGGDVLQIQFAPQVTFLNRAALDRILREVPRGGHVLLDASNTEYIDPDVLDLIRDFREQMAPAHGLQVSLRGFREEYHLDDEIRYVDYSTRELQDQLTAAQVLQILMDGNERFRTDRRLTRDLGRQVDATSKGQHPLAVVLSCIDSRTPAELIFDLGLGDIFSVRVAGNVISAYVLGSMEFGCAVAGAKLILVVGHTSCGAVAAAVNLARSRTTAEQATGCQHLDPIVKQIQHSLEPSDREAPANVNGDDRVVVDAVARRNVLHTVELILGQSDTIRAMVEAGRIAVVGALYDVRTGTIDVIATGGLKLQTSK